LQRVLTKIAVNQSLMSPGLNGAFFGVRSFFFLFIALKPRVE